MSDEGRLVAGRYRLERRIGSGAMGVVWQGVDERLNRTVAIKKLLLPPGLPEDEAEEAVARCKREGRIAARLHHPNAIAVFDVADEDGAPCLIMEYLPSVSLAIALNERGPLAPEEVAAIGAQVAAALAAAHAAGIVHRDIKPGNILLGDDGSVKITDFGISRATDDVTVTKTGLIAGTPAYLAPEVAVGRDPSAASDVFSLGSTLYAATEGEPPFGLSENTLGLLHAVASGKINPPSRSGPLTDVLVALLAGDVEDRPSAAKARDMLMAVARGEDPDVPPVPTGSDSRTRLVAAGAPTTVVGRTAQSRPGMARVAPPPLPPRSRMPLVVAGVGLAAILAVGTFFMINRDTGAGPSQQPNTVDNPSPSVVLPTTSAEKPEVETTTRVVVPTTSQPKQTTVVTTTTTPSVPTTTTTTPPASTTTTTQVTTTTPDPSSATPPTPNQ